MPKRQRKRKTKQRKRKSNKYLRLFKKLKGINRFARKHRVVSKSLKYANMAGNILGYPTTLGYKASVKMHKLGYGLYRT
jgi:hypothetical protein